VAACVSVRGEVEPDPAWVPAYTEGRERFRALYPALRSHYTS
jgi:sugar (pentulose or hexulose) kinase